MTAASLVDGLLSSVAKMVLAGASAFSEEGTKTITVGKTMISISALTDTAKQLASANIVTNLLASTDYHSVVAFLESQTFDSDLVAVADVLGAIGLFIPVVAVAANDLRMIATFIAIAQKVPFFIDMLNGMFGVKGYSTPVSDTYKAIFPTTIGAGNLHGAGPGDIFPTASQ